MEVGDQRQRQVGGGLLQADEQPRACSVAVYPPAFIISPNIHKALGRPQPCQYLAPWEALAGTVAGTLGRGGHQAPRPPSAASPGKARKALAQGRVGGWHRDPPGSGEKQGAEGAAGRAGAGIPGCGGGGQ